MGNGNNSGAPTIIREPAFDAELGKIAGSYQRLADLDDAIDWALSRQPERFFRMSDGYHFWKMERISPHFPQLRIIYYYDVWKNTVLLIAVSEINQDACPRE